MSRPRLVLSRDELVGLLRLYDRDIRSEDLRRWSQAAGGFFDAGEDGIDLLRMVGWAVLRRGRKGDAASQYHEHRERMRLRQLSQSRAGRDIGELPKVADPERRLRASRDFRLFCETYFQQTFYLPWSRDHLKVIAKIEQAVLEGGLFAMAMPRGSGKTSLCETACLWALLYGHREFVALIGSDEEHALNMLESIKSELENNDRLLEDFPDIAYPIQRLEGIHQRATGQLYDDEPTHIVWTSRELVLPTLRPRGWASDPVLRHFVRESGYARGSGGVIRVAGITGRIRGMKHKRPDGRTIRPSLVLVDDPQTDESAKSPSQCAARERVLSGAILGLAGPGRKIAGLMTLTVMYPGDLADRVLDRDKHPQWQGERTKMVYAFPKNEALWAKYAEIRADGLRSGAGTAAATEYYRQHRAEMDEGAEVAWPERYNPDELSAIQHAMNLRFDHGDAAFWAEYQNEPLPDEQPDENLLTAEHIAAKTNGYRRGEVPIGATHLTMFIDVQQKVLFWLVAAWQDDFTGWVIDYGTEPEQNLAYFTLREVKRTLQRAAPRAGLEGAIYAGLERLTERTLGKEWRREDGALVHIDRCLIDANWGQCTDLIYQFCRQSPYARVLLPAHGRYVGAASVPFSEYRRQPGERIGLNWRIPNVARRRAIRHVVFDTNFWKSFVQARLTVPMGDPGCLSLFGHKPERHRLLADHLTAEYCVKTEGRGRTVDEWKLRAAGLDNHWFDCLVGCAVAASIQGVSLPETGGQSAARRGKRLKLSELQRHKRAAQ